MNKETTTEADLTIPSHVRRMMANSPIETSKCISKEISKLKQELEIAKEAIKDARNTSHRIYSTDYCAGNEDYECSQLCDRMNNAIDKLSNNADE